MGNATHFFLGANSGQGFQNLFDRFLRAENHYDLLILKGGPGCGKSTMMRRIGAALEERGEQVEYLHCSGDPDSLDGVYIPRIQTGLVDGTAPHVLEPRYPAAAERYVELGRFYDIAAAKRVRSEIMRRSDACSEAYRGAYRVLGAAKQLEDHINALMMQELDRGKLKKRTDGIIAREIRGTGNGSIDRHRFLGSITCRGMIERLDSVENLCPRIYHLLDHMGAASMMLVQIYSAAKEKKFGTILCPDPEHPDRIRHLLIPELGVAFVTVTDKTKVSSEPYRRIHLDAMISADYLKKWKGRRKLINKMIDALREEGVAILREAKEEHDALEALYQPGIDFAGINELTESELQRILTYL